MDLLTEALCFTNFGVQVSIFISLKSLYLSSVFLSEVLMPNLSYHLQANTFLAMCTFGHNNRNNFKISTIIFSKPTK